MEWKCKLCVFVTSSKGALLKHYRLKHGHFGRGHCLPCIHLNCSCSFRTWGGLRTHLYRAHKSEETESQTDVAFKCKICNLCFPNMKDYFQHINVHLKRLETIECVFDGCEFKTNIYGTYATHRSRKHQCCSHDDLKADVIVKLPTCTSVQKNESNFSSLESTDDVGLETIVDLNLEGHTSAYVEIIGFLLLKLESIYNVSGKCVDDLVEQLQFISASSSQYIPSLVRNILKKNNCVVNEHVISELVKKNTTL